MSEWKTVHGNGQPMAQTVADCVFMSIKDGNLGAPVDVRVSPVAWEQCLRTLGENRPVEFEKYENKAALVTYFMGRKTRVFAHEGEPDDPYGAASYRAAQ